MRCKASACLFLLHAAQYSITTATWDHCLGFQVYTLRIECFSAFLILLCTGFFTFLFFFYLIPSECVHVHQAEGEKGQQEHRINPVLLY